MKVLALNPGSSSLKYKLLDSAVDRDALKEGRIERVQGAAITEAATQVLRECQALGVDAIGCRVVHGGRFTAAVRVSDHVLDAIRGVNHLAPLHNPTDLAVIEGVIRQAQDVPIVAVFDTAFHQTMPEVARHYALPPEVGEDIQRFGFHGIAHRHSTREVSRLLGRGPDGMRLISCHLGAGASICAVRDGRSIDTSMGLTPLEGLVMATRPGDLDPGVVLELIRRGRRVEEVQELLYRASGLLGLSGKSGDLRDLEPAAAAGDARALLALVVYAYRVRKYIGSYAAALGGIDVLTFSGGVGQHGANCRARIVEGLEFLGLRLDEVRNREADPAEPTSLSADGSTVSVWLIPTDEEREIAREVVEVLGE